jgi:GNAT superfamily N-acetyltransferase
MQRVRQTAFEPIFQSFRALVGEEVYVLALSRADAEQAELLTKLCSPDSGYRMFVAVIEHELIGLVCFSIDAEKRIGDIGLNAVHPEHAGQGIGTALYAFVTDQMKKSGMLLATVGTGGDASHLPAQKAYRKAGLARRCRICGCTKSYEELDEHALRQERRKKSDFRGPRAALLQAGVVNDR